jgi:hypothetical protein
MNAVTTGAHRSDRQFVEADRIDQARAVSRAAGSSAPGFSFIDWEA